MIFIGIDAHLHNCTVAMIDGTLKVNKIEFMTSEELIDTIKNSKSSIIAVDAPYKLNKGFMNNLEYRTKLNPKLKGHFNKKVSEYELSRRNIQPFSTPGDLEEINGWKSWMLKGFELYDSLEKLGYSMINGENIDSANKGFIEVFPHACFVTLLEYIPANKKTDEGLNERIEILKKLGIKNFEMFITGSKDAKSDKLDAVVAAYTAYCTYKKQVSYIGDIREGEITLPVKEIRDKYSYQNKCKVEKVKENMVVNFDSEDVNNHEYEYVHIDSNIWLKHLKSINASPDIYTLLSLTKNEAVNIYVEIISLESNQSIEVMLEPLKNSIYGLKPTKDSKEILKKFWGMEGNKKRYKIIIKSIIR